MHPRNNFDAVRLIAAVCVLFTHAFVVAEGHQQNEWMVVLSGYQCPLGLLAVFVFFTISGYLVTGSYRSTRAPLRFLAKRALRILPGLVLSLLVVALVLGLLVTRLSPGAYFADPALYRYLGHNLLMQLGDYPLPGVLFSTNPAGDVVNGSLWTLRYEVMMYLMVLGLGMVRLLRLPVAVGLLVLGMVAIRFETKLDPFGDLGEWAWLVGFFAAGMVLYFLRDRSIWRWQYAVLALVLLIAADAAHLLILLFAPLGGYLALWCARADTRVLRPLNRYGDLSYGVYIYGWPIEQCVVHAGASSWWVVFLVSLPLSLAAGFLSWHAIEKSAIRLGRGRVQSAASTETSSRRSRWFSLRWSLARKV